MPTAYIKQDVFIFNGSLAENISMNAGEAIDMNKVTAIVTRLGLSGISHIVTENGNAGESGNNLSGGQKKLIALGRALYFDKQILLLDEVMASMDKETMQRTLRVLKEEQMKNKTIIIVSHQKEVFDSCDTVYEFKNGALYIQ